MASAPVISAAAMSRGIFRYESRAGAGPMHTSSSANRTCSDSRSASEYTATAWMPSSWQARITRIAISPRLAIRTFLNMRARDRSEGGERSCAVSAAGVLFESRPRIVARALDALRAQGELARVRRVEHRVLIGHHAARIPLHERLIEALHAVLHRALLDEIGNVERFRHVPDLIADRSSVDQDLAGGN